MGWPELWTSLGRISHVKMCFWLMGCVDEQKRRTDEVLRVLRKGYAAQEVRAAIGRYVSIYEAAVLLAELCEQKNRIDEARIFMACAKALKGEMRVMRIHKITARAPCGSGHNKQPARKYTNSVQALSQLLAHYGQKNWQDGSWEDAVPRVATGVAARAHRLKAIGNGQVPSCAAEAFRQLIKRANK